MNDMIERAANVLHDHECLDRCERPLTDEWRRAAQTILAAALEGTTEVCGYMREKDWACGLPEQIHDESKGTHAYAPARVVRWEQP